MVLVKISIVPIGTANTSLSKYIAHAVKVLERSNLSYDVNPMGTVIEGELNQVMDVCREMHESLFNMPEIKRVLTTIKIDDRRDKESTMETKVKSVEEHLTLKS
jgi:uncharacterized protein (TIGR00106 family)